MDRSHKKPSLFISDVSIKIANKIKLRSVYAVGNILTWVRVFTREKKKRQMPLVWLFVFQYFNWGKWQKPIEIKLILGEAIESSRYKYIWPIFTMQIEKMMDLEYEVNIFKVFNTLDMTRKTIRKSGSVSEPKSSVKVDVH